MSDERLLSALEQFTTDLSLFTIELKGFAEHQVELASLVSETSQKLRSLTNASRDLSESLDEVKREVQKRNKRSE